MAPKAKAAPAKAAPADPVEAEKERLTKLVSAACDNLPEKVRPYGKQAAPYAALVIVLIQQAMPYILMAIEKVQEVYSKMPRLILEAILGFVICFFGGVFPTTIAAVEAWRLSGGEEAVENVKVLYQNLMKAHEASKKDDVKDENNDGVADVDQIEGKQLLARKVGVLLANTDAKQINDAVAGLWTGWMGVLAVLKIQFARTITLGHSIGEQIYKPASRYIEPALKEAIPEEYKQWVPIVMRWTCKAVAITIAWWIQRIISASHAAIRGGLLCARALVNYLHQQGKLQMDDKNTYLDEYSGWALAAVGFLFQLWTWFSVPFPLNILFLPITILEAWIQWTVSS
eukprot:gnl/TRDRNA2_/TRDRNA2_130342_c1_seq1.p1 gnl/TRDRNA2_/TRDRNA2_130342_c1~~gnl/TRDRNA2_/TRDRNA2_130342_c1_seq1.p1  ORF type:complete len:343 (+),score=81.68 gnl/TRDRNA2_/TRDRNA2_130342_c1_seq1:87-1115(+)